MNHRFLKGHLPGHPAQLRSSNFKIIRVKLIVAPLFAMSGADSGATIRARWPGKRVATTVEP